MSIETTCHTIRAFIMDALMAKSYQTLTPELIKLIAEDVSLKVKEQYENQQLQGK